MLKPYDSPVYFADRAAFRAWAEQQPRGKWERHDGLIALDPPGITIDVVGLYRNTDLVPNCG